MRSTRPSRAGCRWSSLLSVVVIALWLVVSERGYADGADWRPTRFRVTLRSAEPIRWRGELTLSEGRLERLQPINYDPFAAAGTSVDRGRVLLHYRRPLATDVFDLTTRCPPGAKLALRVESEGEPVTLDLDAARQSRQTTRLDGLGAEVQIDRVENDRVRIESDRESLLFAPGEAFDFTAVVDPPPTESPRAYDLVATLGRGRAGEAVWTGEPIRIDTRDGASRTPISVPLPKAEGVYRVTVEAKRPSGFLDRFPALPGIRGSSAEPILLSRTFQVAVHDPEARPPRIGGWREAYAFDPRVHRWGDRLPEWMRWRRLPWFARGPLSSDSRSDLQAERGGAIEIAAAGAGGSHWRAYPLPIDEVGAAYAVEVQPLGEPGDRLTIAVLEPDALGDLRAVGTAVTLTQPRWNRGEERPLKRLLVRPRTDAPLLVIANPDAERSARFGRIRLLKSTGRDDGTDPSERVVALDWSDCDLPHAVGASHAAVREANYQPYEVPDLLTFYETAGTLADRVEAAGANAAVVPVNQSGAAVYPSRVWRSPYYDLGVWSDGADDLPRRELLRLIGREFERRGLRLIPAVRFDAPTALLESDPNGPNYDTLRNGPTRLRGAAVVEALEAVGGRDVLAGVAVRASSGGWGLLSKPADAEASGQRLSRAYAEIAEHVGERTQGKPLFLLPGGATSGPIAADLLTPRLGENTQAATGFLMRTGLGQLASDGLVATTFGTPREPLSALRRAWPETDKRPIYALRARKEPIRLIASATKLRSGDGRDVVMPATVVPSVEEDALLAQAVAANARLLTLDGSGPAGLFGEDSTALRSAVAAIPVATPAASRSTDHEPLDVLAVTRETAAGESLATVTNRSAWRRRAQITVTTPNRLRGERLFALGGLPQWFEAGRHAVEVELAPYETVVWRFDGPGAAIDGVRLEPNPEAQRELAAALSDLQSRDTTVRRPVTLIRNASFEQGESDGQTPSGWQRRGEASRDASTAIDGAASVRLASTTQAEVELTSKPFATPETGQLAVFLRTQAVELGEDAELRIEVTQPGGDYRRSTRLGAEQLRVAEADGWSPPVLFPLDDLPVLVPGNLQLRVSLSGDAEVLIDDLRTEDLILPLDGYGPIEKRAEKFALVRLMTTGEKLLSEGAIEACRETLDSHWAGFLRDNFPRRSDGPIATTEAPTSEAATDDAAEEKAPSVSQRLRGYLPRWWR